MDAGSPFAVLARLVSVDWLAEDVERRASSRVKLMAEYLRRSALWAEHYGGGGVWPFGDIVQYVAPDFELDPSLAVEVERVLDRPDIGPWGERTARAAVRWAAWAQSQPAAVPDLPPPYEPLVMMFERGGTFYMGEVFIELFGASLPKGARKVRAMQPALPLSTRTLDAVDILYVTGIRTFYLLPNAEWPGGSGPALVRRVSFGQGSEPVDTILDADLCWHMTTVLAEAEKSGGGSESVHIDINQATRVVEEMLEAADGATP